MITQQDPYVEVFIDFLRTRGVLEQYWRNKNNRVLELKPHLFVDGAFIWIGTPEGHGFWRRIHVEWSNLLREAGYYE